MSLADCNATTLEGGRGMGAPGGSRHAAAAAAAHVGAAGAAGGHHVFGGVYTSITLPTYRHDSACG